MFIVKTKTFLIYLHVINGAESIINITKIWSKSKYFIVTNVIFTKIFRF